jgi:hypothetical protein
VYTTNMSHVVMLCNAGILPWCYQLLGCWQNVPMGTFSPNSCSAVAVTSLAVVQLHLRCLMASPSNLSAGASGLVCLPHAVSHV